MLTADLPGARAPFEGFGLESRAAVVAAVSGGSDSLALLLMLKAWRDAVAPRLRIVAATVDHGLRPEAADEARRVAAICAGWNIPHEIRSWVGDKPASGLAEAARHARYGLLKQVAHEARADAVLTGHTMDDQAETVAMRRDRGEGRGLAGMSAATLLHDSVWVVRPLLRLRREPLRALLRQAGQAWIDDPSNEAASSERVRIRRRLMSEAGAVDRLAEEAAHAAARRAAENAAAASLLAAGDAVSPGLVRVPMSILSAEADACLALRALAAAVGGSQHLPSPDAARRLAARLAAGEAAATLSRSVVARHRGSVWLHRERRGLPSRGAVEAGALWDGRFRALSAVDVAPAAARALVDEGDADGVPRRLLTAARAAEPTLSANERSSLVRIVSAWADFLPGVDIGLRNAVARLVGAPAVPLSPAAPSK